MWPEGRQAQRTSAWVLLPEGKKVSSPSSPPHGGSHRPAPLPGDSRTPRWAPTQERSRLGRKRRRQGAARLEAKRWVPGCSNWGGLGKMEQARRVKGRGPVTATCRITADRKLGVGGSGPLRGPPPDSTQQGSARGEAQGSTWAARAIGAGPARCGRRPSPRPRPRPRRPLRPALTSGGRSPRRPEAEPQPREPRARPSGAFSGGGRSPHGLRPAPKCGSPSTPGAREPREWVPGVWSE